MIKVCDCGKRETVQPWSDARAIKGPCNLCREKAKRAYFLAKVQGAKAVERGIAFLRNLRFIR